MKKLTRILLFILLCFPVLLWGQNRQLEYTNKVTISEGLAHNGVTCILEDSRGFLWISTYDGLNRYDGYQCVTYKNLLNKKLFVSNRIRTIAEDKEGKIWLGTDEGISLYNIEKDEFTDVYSNVSSGRGINGPIIRKFMMTENGQVVCATEGDGILVFNKDYTLKNKFVPKEKNIPEDILFHDGIELENNSFLFSTSIGLVGFNAEEGKFSRPFPNESYNGKSITLLDDSHILLSTNSGINVYSYSKTNEGLQFYLHSRHFQQTLFNCSSVDKLGNLWLGTTNQGVIHIQNIDDFIAGKEYKTSYFNSESGFYRISYFLPSMDYGCWVGTFNKGLFQIDLKEKVFKHVNTDSHREHGMRSNEMLHLVAFDDNRFFVSTNAGGAALFNTHTHRFEALPFNVQSQFEKNTTILFVDSKQNIWVKEPSRFGRVKKGSRIIETVEFNDFPEFGDLSPRRLVEDKFGNIWLGCMEGLFKLVINKDGALIEVERLNDHPRFKDNPLTLVRNLYIDPMYNYLWVGTGADGLLRINTDENNPLQITPLSQYTHDPNDPESVSSDFVTTIKRLPNSELWIGTERGGINQVLDSNERLTFVSYSEKDGLSNNVVKRIVFDHEYNLWIPTNIGLNKFNIKTKHFTPYSKQDGLPFDDFLYPSIKLKNDNLVFSGTEGFFYFKPQDIDVEEKLPLLRFGEVSVFNSIIRPGDKLNDRVLLKNRLKANDELELKHNENVFSIELLSLHYSTPENHFLRYRLSPLNEEWIEVPSTQRNVYYNGLQPGKYQLEVMASNAQNEWTEPVLLKVNVRPPFWVTWPAYLLYFLFIALLLYSVFFYLLRLNKLQHRLEIEELEKDKVKEVNEAKLRFFSNISHEIKTPLTLISGPVNLLSERFKANEDVSEKLKIIQRQSRKMLRLVNQVHDFQRSDANQLKINYSLFCFNDFLREVLIDFNFKAQNDKKQFILKEYANKIVVSADKDKLEKIINNLLSNAFNYTKPGDSISIEYRIVAHKLEIKVIDTGKGIDVEDLPHIFERFYQSKKKQSAYTGGSGIGLAFTKRLVEMHYGSIDVNSLLQKGSTFTVMLPVLSDEEVKADSSSEEKILEVEKVFDESSQVMENIDPAKIKVGEEFKKTRLFFAEDNTDMRTFVSGVLSNFFDVQSFINGKECLDAMSEEWPELLISDVLMPEMNGFELCKHIKNDIKTSHIPVILLTACTSIEEQLEGIEVGADSYIKKPFNVQHLVSRIENLLRTRQNLRERFQIDFPLKLEKKKDNDIVFLDKLYKILEENLDNQNIDLDRVAKELYLNRTHFYQKVKAITNQTPFELLKTYRLKKAAELLVQKQLSVNEVYLMTGFKSRTHFSKLFKEKYNTTPGKYAAETLAKMSES